MIFYSKYVPYDCTCTITRTSDYNQIMQKNKTIQNGTYINKTIRK